MEDDNKRDANDEEGVDLEKRDKEEKEGSGVKWRDI